MSTKGSESNVKLRLRAFFCPCGEDSLTDGNGIWNFMSDVRYSLKNLHQQVKTYYNSALVHHDRNKNLHEENPDWRGWEILIQYQLILAAFIKNLLSDKDKAVFACAAEFEKTLQAIRQEAYQCVLTKT